MLNLGIVRRDNPGLSKEMNEITHILLCIDEINERISYYSKERERLELKIFEIAQSGLAPQKIKVKDDTTISSKRENEQRIARMIGLKQAAEETGLPYECLRLMCVNKEVPHVKSGRKYFINANELKAALKGQLKT